MDDLQQRERELAQRIASFVNPSSPHAVAAATAFLLTFYVGLALAYRDAVPLFEAPDEPSHIHYAAFVYTHARLPRQQSLEVPGEGMQAPLVYAVSAPLLGNTGIDVAHAADELRLALLPYYSHPQEKAGGPAIAAFEHGKRQFVTDGSLEPLRVLRSTSLAFGLLTVILTFAAMWRLTRDARMALLAGSLVAFNPQFLFSSGYFSNDPAAAAIGAAALWIVVRALEDPERAPARRDYFAGALLIGLGALTKTSTLPGLAVAAVTLVAVDHRARPQVRRDVASAAALVLLLAGPYLIWAAKYRGGLLGIDAVVASTDMMHRAHGLGGQLYLLAGNYWQRTLESFWGRFGWFNVLVPRATLLAFFAITWTGALGWIAGRERLLPESLGSRLLRRYLLAAFGATLAVHLAMNLMITNPQGRLLFPCISQIAFLLALGIYRLIGSPKRMLPLTISVVLLLVALDVYCLRGVLVPAYR